VTCYYARVAKALCLTFHLISKNVFINALKGMIVKCASKKVIIQPKNGLSWTQSLHSAKRRRRIKKVRFWNLDGYEGPV